MPRRSASSRAGRTGRPRPSPDRSAGAGKSHLGAIWADIAGARRVAARDLAGIAPADALATGALLLEDAGPRTSEVALFHLLNAAREEDAFLLLTAREAPVSWGVGLKDLASRLRALPVSRWRSRRTRCCGPVLVKLFAIASSWSTATSSNISRGGWSGRSMPRAASSPNWTARRWKPAAA